MFVLEYIDQISYQPKLKIFKNDYYFSKIGLFSYLSIIICSIVVGIIFFLNVINKKNVSVIFTETFNKPATIEMSKFPITFQLVDVIGRQISDEESVYNFSVSKIEYRNINGTRSQNNFSIE